MPAHATDLESLLSALDRLDAHLRFLVALAMRDRPQHHPWSGIVVSADEVAELLARDPGDALGVPVRPPFCAAVESSSGPGRLAQQFDLTPFQLDVVLLALAPELDLRYERIYGFLSDDLTRRRPTVDLALGLLCPSREARLLRRAEFADDAPLVRCGLVHVEDGAVPAPPLLARSLRLDDQVVAALLGTPPAVPLGGRGVLPRAAGAKGVLSRAAAASIVARLRGPAAGDRGLPRPYLWGTTDATSRAVVELAEALGIGVLELDLGDRRVVRDLASAVQDVVRRARLRDEVACLRLPPNADVALTGLWELLARQPGPLVLAGAVPAVALAASPGDLAEIPVVAGPTTRRAAWREALDTVSIKLDETELDLLARRCPLPPEIASRVAANSVRGDHGVGLRELLAAARGGAGRELDALAVRIDDEVDWEDLVLDPDRHEQLRELCRRVERRHEVLDTWGFASRTRTGTGVTALFTGPPGSGKTMAASVIGTALGRPLHAIDLARVVSKYIGETEQRLDRIFAEAEASGAILLFDEADALFGKRSEVKDAHDRYGNIGVAHLLQRMERYEGVTLLSTNLRHNLDEAFLRRLAFVIEFAAPDTATRLRIWRGVWPATAPLDPHLDLAFLAEHFELTGGYIRNIALSAAYEAAATGAQVSMAHLVAATRREYQKLGRVAVDADFGPYAHLIDPVAVTVAVAS